MEEELIEAVKIHEVLYKTSCLDYRNREKRAAAWNSIAQQLNTPENVCQTRWKTLRDRFVKKHAEINASGSGAETEENQWRYYRQMEFLCEYIKPRKTVTRLTSSQSMHELAHRKRKLPRDQISFMEADENPSNENSHAEIPEYNFIGKFEEYSFSDEYEAKDTEYQTWNLNKDKEHISIRKDDQTFNINCDLNDIEREQTCNLDHDNKNETKNQSISVSIATNGEEILKNNISCKCKATNRNNNDREEENLLNFFRSCIDDILILDKRKQRLFKKRILDVIDELQDS